MLQVAVAQQPVSSEGRRMQCASVLKHAASSGRWAADGQLSRDVRCMCISRGLDSHRLTPWPAQQQQQHQMLAHPTGSWQPRAGAGTTAALSSQQQQQALAPGTVQLGRSGAMQGGSRQGLLMPQQPPGQLATFSRRSAMTMLQHRPWQQQEQWPQQQQQQQQWPPPPPPPQQQQQQQWPQQQQQQGRGRFGQQQPSQPPWQQQQQQPADYGLGGSPAVSSPAGGPKFVTRYVRHHNAAWYQQGRFLDPQALHSAILERSSRGQLESAALLHLVRTAATPRDAQLALSAVSAVRAVAVAKGRMAPWPDAFSKAFVQMAALCDAHEVLVAAMSRPNELGFVFRWKTLLVALKHWGDALALDKLQAVAAAMPEAGLPHDARMAYVQVRAAVNARQWGRAAEVAAWYRAAGVTRFKPAMTALLDKAAAAAAADAAQGKPGS